jgi:adenylate cyclase class 2
MSVETEVKLRLGDVEQFWAALDSLGGEIVSPRHFEDNFVLDFSDGRIRSQRALVRVRITEHACFLTYKGPPAPAGPFKSRMELETTVGDGLLALQILESLGMRISFRYQKYRRERAADGVHIAVDETPIGAFAELEGPPEAILRVAAALGFAEDAFIRSSYHGLFRDLCRAQGIPERHMVFQ